MTNTTNKFLDTQAVTDFYKGVIQFNQVAGGTRENYNHELQVKLMDEEWEETLKAYNEKDSVGFLGEMLDVLVTHGYAQEVSGEGDSVFIGQWSGSGTDSFSGVVEQNTWHERLDIMEQFCVTLKHKYGVDIEGAMAEVNRSNMSKFCNTSERSYFCSMLIYHCEAINNGGRYTGVTWTEVGNYIVFKDGNGKVMKGPDFTAPDLTPYVGNLSKFLEEEGINTDTQNKSTQNAYEVWTGQPLPEHKPNFDEVLNTVDLQGFEQLFGEVLSELLTPKTVEVGSEAYDNMIKQIFAEAEQPEHNTREARTFSPLFKNNKELAVMLPMSEFIDGMFAERLAEAEEIRKSGKLKPEQIPAKVSSSLSFTPEEVDVMFELLCMTHTEDGAAHSAMAKLESYASDEAVQRLETCDQRFTSVDTDTGFELNKEGHITLLEKNNDEGGI